MNNEEQQNNDERFTLVELANGGFAVYDEAAPGKMDEVCIFWQGAHPYAKKAAEDARDALNAWHREGGTILPAEYLPKPRRVPLVIGEFSKAEPHTLTVAEKRRFLAKIFRSQDFTDADKFEALQADNRMLILLTGKEQIND